MSSTATGGIGGVHKGAELSFDVSADLTELAATPVTVVAAGAKAILDLPKTLEVLETRRLRLAPDEVGTLGLPNGKPLRVRPLRLDDSGVLLAVEVKDTLQTDLRVRNGHLVVIGAGRHQGGRLVISFEPRW